MLKASYLILASQYGVKCKCKNRCYTILFPVTTLSVTKSNWQLNFSTVFGCILIFNQ